MSTFEWDDETFEALSPERWLIGELRHVERLLGGELQKSGSADRGAALVFVSIKRHRPAFTWADVDAVPVSVLLALASSMGQPAEQAEPAPAVEAPVQTDSGVVLSPTSADS